VLSKQLARERWPPSPSREGRPSCASYCPTDDAPLFVQQARQVLRGHGPLGRRIATVTPSSLTPTRPASGPKEQTPSSPCRDGRGRRWDCLGSPGRNFALITTSVLSSRPRSVRSSRSAGHPLVERRRQGVFGSSESFLRVAVSHPTGPAPRSLKFTNETPASMSRRASSMETGRNRVRPDFLVRAADSSLSEMGLGRHSGQRE